MKKLYIILTLFLMIVISCKKKEIRKSEIIDILSDELKGHKNEYLEVISIITKLNMYGQWYLTYLPKEPVRIGVYNIDNSNEVFKVPENETLKLYNFMKTRKCYLSPNIPEYFEFDYFNSLNANGQKYRLINHLTDKVDYSEQYKSYEIVKKDNLPKKECGWIYLLRGNWIILSPKEEDE